MSTIFTKYLPRNTLPARIKAYTSNRGQAVYIAHDTTQTDRANHTAACDKLAAKLHWHDRHFVAGPTPEGFIFVPCDVTGEHTHHNELLPHADTPPKPVPATAPPADQQ